MNAATLIQTTVHTRRELASLVGIQDPHLTFEGLRARQRQQWGALRDRLTALMPTEPTVPDRQGVYDSLKAKNADDLAFQAREWAKVRALLDAGKSIVDVTEGGDRVRLAAILDNIETMPEVLEDEGVGEAIRSVVWDRLTETDREAQGVVAAERAALPALAWRSIIEGVAATGEIPYDGLVLLREADQAAYDLLVEGDAHATPAPSGGSIPRLVEALTDGEDA